MQDLRLAQQLRSLTQRAFHWALLVVMACFLSLASHAHVHSAERVAAPAIQAPEASTVLVAAQAEETCAICVWKAHTPYVPAKLPPTTVIVVEATERSALQPRAPPAIALPFLRNRAPPAVLS